MQIAVDIPFSNIITLVSQMNLNQIEELKNKIIEKELYFKKFKKDKIDDIMQDFKQEGYSKDFLSDIENGLKKSSLYDKD